MKNVKIKSLLFQSKLSHLIWIKIQSFIFQSTKRTNVDKNNMCVSASDSSLLSFQWRCQIWLLTVKTKKKFACGALALKAGRVKFRLPEAQFIYSSQKKYFLVFAFPPLHVYQCMYALCSMCTRAEKNWKPQKIQSKKISQIWGAPEKIKSKKKNNTFSVNL